MRAGGTFHFLTAGHRTEDPYGPTPPYPLWNDGAGLIGFTAGSNFPGDDFGIVQYVPRPGSVPSTVVGGGNRSVGGTTFFRPVAEAASYDGVTVP
ncbi:hypothetical protein [Streptomyces marincola]|uniref:Uncharacterized protein n=1 Tax=Streptomyces marincola TaxID=2878388 RepID=A0A1W7CZI3_9ACTN|nr:hypothetical protein [Streptomyces marincola]ARQ70176.1 hypothetical protein CAG99_16160 [Streptomyces marincola]